MSSREETQALRVQLEEQREKARKEMQEVHRHGNDAQTELERNHLNLRRLEEEVCLMFYVFVSVLTRSFGFVFVFIMKIMSGPNLSNSFDT